MTGQKNGFMCLCEGHAARRENEKENDMTNKTTTTKRETLSAMDTNAIEAGKRAAAAIEAAVNAWNDAGWKMETFNKAFDAGNEFYLAMQRAAKQARERSMPRD